MIARARFDCASFSNIWQDSSAKAISLRMRQVEAVLTFL